MDRELDELKKEFLAEALEKVEEMASLLDREPNAESFERLAYLAHQLKGSGGSYSYQKISTDAAAIEKAVEQLAEGDGDGRAKPQIQENLGNLRAEIDKHARALEA